MENLIIKRNLNYIIENLELLEKNIKLLNLENDKFKKRIFKNSISEFVEEIVEKAVKINSLLLKEKNIFFETYFQGFIKLNKVYDLNFNDIEKLAKTTSFRNNLVHNYDNKITQFNLENNLDNFISLYKEYTKLISKLINH